jgi:hypothetical protein
MNINNNIAIKRVYNSPEIKLIRLDYEISLQLTSPATPNSGDEVYNAPDYFNHDPFKSGLA